MKKKKLSREEKVAIEIAKLGKDADKHRYVVLTMVKTLIDASEDSDVRKELLWKSLVIVVSKGTTIFALDYFNILKTLPDMMLAYDVNSLFRYATDRMLFEKFDKN